MVQTIEVVDNPHMVESASYLYALQWKVKHALNELWLKHGNKSEYDTFHQLPEKSQTPRKLNFSLDPSLVITERSTPAPFRSFDQHSQTVQPLVTHFFPSNAFMASARSFNTLYGIAKAVISN